MKTILAVDDDPFISSLLRDILSREGYRVITAFSGSEALLIKEREHIDLVLLDLMLPGLSGEEVISSLSPIPVIVLSAKDSGESRVNMLRLGAVDFVSKPFVNEELLLRISLRIKENTSSSRTLEYGRYTLSQETRELMVDSVPLHLTRTEYSIMKQLMLGEGNVVPRSRLLDRISEDTPDCTESSLKQHVSNLRKKLSEVTKDETIEAVWGIGFRLK